jgi:VIT1/CCC1 family predicted Fe2+/Mn2+ transporter
MMTGVMTFLGGILHTLPFVLPNLSHALYAAYIIVGIELVIIAYIRNRYFHMNFLLSSAQVIFGGLLVVLAGILIGSS